MTSIDNPGASAGAIQYHYDVSDEFYKLWLDEAMVYSCGLWDHTDNLEEAQRAKIDFHIEQAEARGKQRVLDVGCGWGTTLQRLVDADVKQAIGLTLAKRQAAHIEAQRWPGVETRVESWTDHTPTSRYDAIISVGAFEHFARLDTSPEEKIAGYRSFFQRCHEWLPPGGCVSLQTMSYESSSRSDFSEFFASQIFPESDLPRLSEIAEASEGLFEIVNLRNDRKMYARTSLAWRARLKRRRAEAIALVGKDVVDRYDKYLQMWAIGFHVGSMGLLRLKLRNYGRK